MASKQKRSTALTVRIILIVGLIVLVLTGIGVYSYLSGRITMNPEGTIGNTAGNLNNGGLFCEYNGVVYYANAADGGALYSMNPDETDPQRLNSSEVSNILAGGDYLYYAQTGGATGTGLGSVVSTNAFFRSKLDGSSATELTRDTVELAQLVDNYLYLYAGRDGLPVFTKLKIDKSESTDLLENVEINPACAESGTIYYSETTNNLYLYAWDTSSDASREILGYKVWYPCLYNGYFYFLDVSNDYRLCRYSIADDVVEILTMERVDCFNVGNGYVYYQTNSENNPQLKGMGADGSNPFVLAEGIYDRINMTSQYVYFQDYGTDGVQYHSALGSGVYGSWE